MITLRSLDNVKREAVLGIMRFTVNTLAYINALLYQPIEKKSFYSSRKHQTGANKFIPVYMTVNSSYFPLVIISILSLSFFVRNIKFILIPDGKLRKFQKFIINNTNLNIKIISAHQLSQIDNSLRPYKNLNAFYKFDWQGKKLIVPLLTNKSKKFIVLDPDTIFLSDPIELKNWITKKNGCVYLEDCDNYFLISPWEAKSLLNKTPKLSKVNTGLLGLDTTKFINILPLLDKYIAKIININGTRRTKIYSDKIPFENTEHLLEQTLYWLLLEDVDSMKLSDKYYVFGKHLYKGKSIGNPDFIHFAGEKNKKSMYRYVFISFTKWVLSAISSKRVQKIPWYRYSNIYCHNCWHNY